MGKPGVLLAFNLSNLSTLSKCETKGRRISLCPRPAWSAVSPYQKKSQIKKSQSSLGYIKHA